MTEINTIIDVLAPDKRDTVPVESAKLEVSLQIADQNGLLYPFMQRLDFSDLPDQYLNRVEKHRRHRSMLKNTVRTLNRIGEASGVEFAIIKDANSIEHLPRDVDVLVHPDDKDSFLTAAREHGLKCDQSGDIETSMIGDNVFPIDLYTRIIYFGVEFLSPVHLLSETTERSIFNVGYPGISSESALLLTLVHGVFGHRRFTLLDYLHIRNLRGDGTDHRRSREIASDHGWEETFNLLIGLLDEMDDSIQRRDTSLQFPYVIPYFRMMDFIRSVDGIDLGVQRHILIFASLLIDGMKIRIENSSLHEPIRQIEPLRKLLLKIAYHSRRGRGDKYS